MPAKRKHRETFGMIDELPSGRIRARYTGPDGKRYAAPRTFDNKTDARGWLSGQQSAISRDTWISPELLAEANAEASQTLAEYATTWLGVATNRGGKSLRPRTVDEYRRLIAGPLKDLAGLPLNKITAVRVDKWFAAQSATGKLTQASRAYSLLSTIMSHAVDRRIGISENPCRVRGGQSARTGRKVLPPSDDELATIITTIAPRYQALVYLAAEAGLRYGEASDLHVSDITVERDEHKAVERVLVSVTHAVTRTRNGFESGPPKSEAGIRSVYVYGKAAEAIAEHIKTNVARFGDPLLFPAGDGTHLAQSTFIKHWYPAREAAGRTDMPFHALRHRAGTVYVQHGATMQEAMTRLGHSSTAVAMRYQHATGRDAEIAARMAGKTPA